MQRHAQSRQCQIGAVVMRGGFLDRANLKRAFYRIPERPELSRVRFHSLRQSGNTILAPAGLSLKVLQHRLGHAKSRVTFDTYTHYMASDGKVAAHAIGSLLSPGLEGGLEESEVPYRL